MIQGTAERRRPARRTLPSETSSVRAARLFITEALPDVAETTLESAVLLTSELVTNAILHARSSVDLFVGFDGSTVRIEVGDQSPAAPTRRERTSDAATGRGIQILATLAARWGVDVKHDAKVVWFELDEPPAPAPATSADAAPPEAPTDDSTVPVTIVGLPLTIYRRSSDEYAGVMREFRLIIEASPEARATVPGELLDLVDELTERFGAFAAPQTAEIDAACERGLATVDLTYALPPAVGAACRRLDELLDLADAYCAAGTYLLTLVPSPEVVAFRRWFLTEFARQVAGATPTRFSPHATEVPSP